MLIDNVKEYYLNQNYNCCESIVRGANDYYHLGLHHEDMKMVAAFGAGVQTGDFCGALAACACILSVLYVKEKAHESVEITSITQEMIEKFEKELSSRYCNVVKPTQFNPEVRCLGTVDKACNILEQIIMTWDIKLRK